MPRAARVVFPGVPHHVTQVGLRHEDVFTRPAERRKYLRLLGEYSLKYGLSISAYCLMSNHFHFLMQILKAKDLPFIMKGISQTFANYHRRKYRNVGYLFQARYKSFHIEKDEYLLECARYIERNPLRANIVKELSEYPYSSYNYYAIGKKDDIITTNILYPTFGRTLEERRRNYIEYVSKPRPHEQLLDKAIASIK